MLAHFGELHPSILQEAGFDSPVVVFEVFLDRIPEPKRRKKSAPDLSPFQPVRRDFAFLAAHDVPVEAILRAAKGAERNLITGVSLFDIYEGDKLPEGQKSVGIEIVIQPKDASLTDAQLEAVSEKVIAAVAKATGASLRS